MIDPSTTQPPCDHGVVFDEALWRATTRSVEITRQLWPRLFGECPKGCGYCGIAYASTAHFLAGDW